MDIFSPEFLNLLREYWEIYLGIDEWVGGAVGIIVVYCLIREQVFAWPLGVLYVLISIAVPFEARLYSNLVLHVCAFLPLNLYGWYAWLAGREGSDKMPITRTSWKLIVGLLVACAVGVLLLPYFYSLFVDDYEDKAALVVVDNTVLMLSLTAMWLTARKKIENWIFWFVVNILSVGMYVAQDVYPYAVLYAAYLGMAVWGYVRWSHIMLGTKSSR